MKSRLLSGIRILIIFAVIIFIYALFFSECKNAAYSGYTFAIDKALKGNETELTVINTANKDHIGGTVYINEDSIQLDGDEYTYFVKKKGSAYDFVILKSEGEYRVFTNVSASDVDFRSDFDNYMTDYGNGGGSVAAGEGVSENTANDDNDDLLASVLTVYLAVTALYGKLKIYLAVYAVVLVLCCLCYFKPEVFNKAFNRESYAKGNEGKVKAVSCLIMVAGALAVFLFIM